MKEKLKKEQRETKRKQANGITLIALVITIIVLLILAGVSIAMLTGQNGILSQAQNAKKQTEQASENENKDMDKTIAIINDYTGSTLGKNQIDKNRTLSGAENGYTYKNPVIPKGFRAVNDGAAWYYTDDESTEVKGWNDGLVIEDEKGNQFVWVPVDGTNVTYAKRDFSDNLNSYKTYVDAYPDGIDTEQEEIDLIEKYGGFYIGRFEAGLERDSNENYGQAESTPLDYTDIPVSKYGVKVWNSIDFFNAYKSSKLMINNDSVKSGLVTGLAWDTIMTWFEDSGIDISESCTWGAYSTTSYSVNGWYFLCGDFVGEWINGAFPKNVFDQQVDKRYGHASGLNSNGYQKDIADIGGNLFEWSCEQSTETSYYFAYRGGCMQHGNMDLGASWHGYPSIRASNSGYWAYPNARI